MIRRLVKIVTREGADLRRKGLANNAGGGGPSDELADPTFLWPFTFATGPPNDSRWSETPVDHSPRPRPPGGSPYGDARFAVLIDEEREEAIEAMKRGKNGLSANPYIAPWGRTYDSAHDFSDFAGLQRSYRHGGYSFFQFSNAADVDALIDPLRWVPRYITEVVYNPSPPPEKITITSIAYDGYRRELENGCRLAFRRGYWPVIIGAITTHPGRRSFWGKSQPGTNQLVYSCRVRNIGGITFSSRDSGAADAAYGAGDGGAYLRAVLEHAHGEMLAML